MAIISLHLHQPVHKIKIFKSVIQLVQNPLDQVLLGIPGLLDQALLETLGLLDLTRPRPVLFTLHRPYLGSLQSPIHGTVMMATEEVFVNHSRNKFITSTKILEPVEKLFIPLFWQNSWKINSFFRMFSKTKKF